VTPVDERDQVREDKPEDAVCERQLLAHAATHASTSRVYRDAPKRRNVSIEHAIAEARIHRAQHVAS
jgi:hypothetical protein